MKKRTGKLRKLLLTLAMLLGVLPFMGLTALAADTAATGYKLTYVYPEDLCELSAYDWYDADRTPIENGGILPINTEKNQTYGVFEAKNIADGYRIKRFTVTGTSTVDMTQGFVNGAYGGIAMSIREDSVVTLELEPVPEELPSITGVTLYTDQAGTTPAQENISYGEGDTGSRLYGIAAYSDGGNYPVYYTTGQWEYSTDGVTWLRTESWGSNRYDFWPGWPYHEELDFLTDSYDLRLCAQPRDLYTTGGNVYSNVLHVNGGADAPTGLTKLATPTDLSWGREYDWDTVAYEETPGFISWKREPPTQNQFEVIIYSRETGEAVSSMAHHFGATSTPPYFSTSCFLEGFWPDECGATPDCNFDSGTYYFTVQAVGDGVQYSDSDIAQSPDWTYVKPEAHLATPTNLRWSGRESHWDMPGDTSDALGYSVEYCFYDAGSDAYIPVGGSTIFYLNESADSLMDDFIEGFGVGQYYFRVRAISRDMTKICNSLWSELSPAYDLTEISGAVDSTLDSILDGYRDIGEITEDDQAALKEDLWAQTDTDALDAAMAADQENTGTVARIEELETLVGGPAGVVVNTGAPAGLVAGDISIIGANLNTEGSAAATLQVSAPSEGVVIPELYDNTVQFSMKLENVEETVQGQQLKVPVKITMPVPENINPDFLVLLHFHQDGTYEEIMNPYAFEKDDRMFVSFVVTSFSDFAIAQRSMGVFLDDIDLEEHTITATVATEMNGTLMAAVYENGKMTGLASAAVSADGQVKQASLSLPTLTAGAEVKLFLIDGSGMPLYEAVSQTVS